MKRLANRTALALCMAGVMLLSMGFALAAASGASITVDVPSGNAAISGGETFEVTVTAAAAGESHADLTGVAGMMIDLAYDADNLTVSSVDVKLDGKFIHAVNSAYVSDGTTSVRLVFVNTGLDGTAAIDAEEPLMTVTFKVNREVNKNSVSFSVNVVEAYDLDDSEDGFTAMPDDSITENNGGSVNVEDAKYMRGDVNEKNGVTATDAQWILQYVVGKRTLSDTALLAADVNVKNGVTATDAQWILQAVVGKRDIETFEKK